MAKVGMNFLLTFDKYLINMRKCIDKNIFKNVKIHDLYVFQNKIFQIRYSNVQNIWKFSLHRKLGS